MKRFFLALFAGTILLSATGCPDYSHLREVPDYENMTDSAGEISEGEVPSDEAGEGK